MHHTLKVGMQNILVNQKICPLKENNTGCPLIVSALDDVNWTQARDLFCPCAPSRAHIPCKPKTSMTPSSRPLPTVHPSPPPHGFILHINHRTPPRTSLETSPTARAHRGASYGAKCESPLRQRIFFNSNLGAFLPSLFKPVL